MTFSISPVLLRHASGTLSGHGHATTTSVPWRVASKFQSTQHRREAYVGVLRDNLAAFRAALTDGTGPLSTSQDPALPGEVHHRTHRPGQDSPAHDVEHKGSTGILASTPMPYTFLFDTTPMRSASSPSWSSPAETDASADPSPPPLLFPSGWVEHATRQLVLATDGVLSPTDIHHHRGYFLSALVHPSYLSHTWTTVRRRIHTSQRTQWHTNRENGGGTGEWWRWLSDPKVQEAMAMPPAFIRTGAAALRVMEEVSWMPLQVPLPSSSSSLSEEWEAKKRGEEEEETPTRGRHAALYPPPLRAPPLTGERLFSVAIHSGLASCMLWHPPHFFHPRSSSASVETRRIASSSVVFMENPTREPIHGKEVVDPTVNAPARQTSTSRENATHPHRVDDGGRPLPLRDGTTEEVPVEVIADGVTAFCGALDLVMGTMKMAAFLDLYVSPEEEKKNNNQKK